MITHFPQLGASHMIQSLPSRKFWSSDEYTYCLTYNSDIKPSHRSSSNSLSRTSRSKVSRSICSNLQTLSGIAHWDSTGKRNCDTTEEWLGYFYNSFTFHVHRWCRFVLIITIRLLYLRLMISLNIYMSKNLYWPVLNSKKMTYFA